MWWDPSSIFSLHGKKACLVWKKSLNLVFWKPARSWVAYFTIYADTLYWTEFGYLKRCFRQEIYSLWWWRQEGIFENAISTLYWRTDKNLQHDWLLCTWQTTIGSTNMCLDYNRSIYEHKQHHTLAWRLIIWWHDEYFTQIYRNCITFQADHVSC